MPYFFINLAIHISISIGILLVILFCVKKNATRKNRRGIYFLLPTILTLVFMFQVIQFSIPRALDIVYVLKNNYRSEQGVVESVGYLNHSVVINKTVFYFNPFLYKPEKGDELLVSYSPNAKYINDFQRIENNNAQNID